MNKSKEVDELDSSCTVSKQELDNLIANHENAKVLVEKAQKIVSICKDKIDKIALNVLFRLTDFSEVLENLPEGELRDEIELQIDAEYFTKEALKNGDKIHVLYTNDGNTVEFYTYDRYDGCNNNIVYIPTSYLYRFDWIFKLVVEKEAYLAKKNKL